MRDDPFETPEVPDASDRTRSGDGEKGLAARRWPWFLAGVVLGTAAALLVPRYLGPYLPASFRAGQVQIRGPVLAEQLEEDRLLLTVETEQGAMLATFRQRTPEIALLVDEGDTVTLGLKGYSPFVEEPTLLGVYKGRPPAGGEAADTAGARPLRPDTLPEPGVRADTAGA